MFSCLICLYMLLLVFRLYIRFICYMYLKDVYIVVLVFAGR